MFDLADLDIVTKGDEPQPLDLIDPRTNAVVVDADGQPARLYVLSSYSETMQDFMDEQANKQSKHAKQPTAEDVRDRALAITARLLMARPWEHIHWAGQPLAFNVSNAKLLMQRLPWARRQVELFAAQEGNFLPASSASSSSTPSTNAGSASTSTDVAAANG